MNERGIMDNPDINLDYKLLSYIFQKNNYIILDENNSLPIFGKEISEEILPVFLNDMERMGLICEVMKKKGTIKQRIEIRKPELILHKSIDFSIFNDGITLPIQTHDIFDNLLGLHLFPGDRIKIKLIVDDHKFDARIVNADRKVKSDTYQLRYDSNHKLQTYLRTKCSTLYNNILWQREKGKTEGKERPTVNVPDYCYVELLSTKEENTLHMVINSIPDPLLFRNEITELGTTDELFLLIENDVVTKSDLFQLIIDSKQSDEMLTINCSPQQGINPIGNDPNFSAVIIKSYRGSNPLYSDRWLDENKKKYLYELKRDVSKKEVKINYNHVGNRSLMNEKKYKYPILLFTENPKNIKDVIFQGQFNIDREITDRQGNITGFIFNKIHFRDHLDDDILDSYYQKSIEITKPNLDKVTKKPKPIKSISRSPSAWKRDPTVGSNSKASARYRCEIDNNHQYFKSKTTEENYVEAHHLIPLGYQDRFEYSIDIEPNVITLCPLCHKKFHHASLIDIEIMVEKLYNDRNHKLQSCGIELSYNQLLEYYR